MSAKDTKAKAGFLDRRSAAAYFGMSPWTFDNHVRKGVLPRGVTLAPGGKALWSVRALDDAFYRAARSRKPRREPRGIVRHRLEARRRVGADNE
jgi:hypothetical protein